MFIHIGCGSCPKTSSANDNYMNSAVLEQSTFSIVGEYRVGWHIHEYNMKRPQRIMRNAHMCLTWQRILIMIWSLRCKQIDTHSPWTFNNIVIAPFVHRIVVMCWSGHRAITLSVALIESKQRWGSFCLYSSCKWQKWPEWSSKL